MEKMLPYLLLLIFGCGLTMYAFYKIRKANQREEHLNDLVAEAKLVHHNLKLILNETKDVTDVLVEHVQRADKLVNEFTTMKNIKHFEHDLHQNNLIKPHEEIVQPQEEHLGEYKRKKIKELRQTGYNTVEIARVLDIGKGEVELYIKFLDKQLDS